jgi:hypothetical protein
MTHPPLRLPVPEARSPESGDPSWLITLADLAGLMLVFFVMLFAMSEIDRKELQRISGNSLIYSMLDDVPKSMSVTMPLPSRPDGRDPGYLASVIRAKFESDPALADLTVEDKGDRAIVFVPLQRLRMASVPGDGEPLFHALAGALRMLPNSVMVESRLSPTGAGADRARWRTALLVGYRAAKALESAGLAGPIGARAAVGAQPGQSGLNIVIFAAGRPDLQPAEQ